MHRDSFLFTFIDIALRIDCMSLRCTVTALSLRLLLARKPIYIHNDIMSLFFNREGNIKLSQGMEEQDDETERANAHKQAVRQSTARVD